MGGLEFCAYWELTALHVAAKWASVSVERELINHGAEVHVRSTIDMTPLHWACSWGPWLMNSPTHCARRQEIIDLLLENQADINERTLLGQTPLFRGVRSGLVGLVRLLVERGVDMSKEMGDKALVPSAIFTLLFHHEP